MSTIEERVAALEKDFEEVKKNKVIAVRGPAGPIDAAVTNARAALAEDLADTLKRCTELQREVQNFNGKLDNRILSKIQVAATTLQEKLDSFQKNIETEVEAIVLKTLQQYWLLDSECRVLGLDQKPNGKK